MSFSGNDSLYGISKPITVRIPPLQNVDLTEGIWRIIDTPQFQKLRKIKQLSLTHLVYPGANHTRFEHSLGVFSLMMRYLNHLSLDERFCKIIRDEHLRALPFVALLHDIGHYPFGHLVEREVSDLPSHEIRSQEIVQNLDIVELIRDQMVDPVIVGQLITGDFDQTNKSMRLAGDLIDSSIDVDKMDYLERDSLHCGVPYGRSYDKERLISSLTVSPNGRLALSAKGKSSVEYIIFSRYIMLTDVYWHHTVRSAAIMLIRAMQEAIHFPGWSGYRKRLLEGLGDEEALNALAKIVESNSSVFELLRGLRNRDLYKRIRTYSPFDPDSSEVFSALKGLSGPHSARVLSMELIKRLNMAPLSVLVDIVPSKAMTQDVTVFFEKRNKYRKLSEISPIAKSLADTWQSLTGVVRVFCHPLHAGKMRQMGSEIDRQIIESANVVKSELFSK